MTDVRVLRCGYCALNQHWRCLFESPESPKFQWDACACADAGHPHQPAKVPNPAQVTIFLADGPYPGERVVDAALHHKTGEPTLAARVYVDVDGPQGLHRYHRMPAMRSPGEVAEYRHGRRLDGDHPRSEAP